jgi:hydroxymethylglutaryl-CoA lyase
MGQPLGLELYTEKLKPIAGCRSKRLGGVCARRLIYSLAAKRSRTSDRSSMYKLTWCLRHSRAVFGRNSVSNNPGSRHQLSNFSLTAKKPVQIVEVGPRDGLQTERPLPVEDRTELIRRLVLDAGLHKVEVGSFVSEKRVPQMAQTEQVIARLQATLSTSVQKHVTFPVLVPNEKHLERALNAGCQDFAVFVSSTEGFSQRNLGCSVSESLEKVDTIFRRLEQEPNRDAFSVRGYVSCIFMCPFDGDVSPAHVRQVASALLEMGCYEVSLGDTLGMGTPAHVRRLLDELFGHETRTAGKYAVHFHDTYGMAVANILCAIEEYDICVVDSSVGGLGGCPFAPGSTGNVATEDVLYLLQGLERAEKGVDLMKLTNIGAWINAKFGRETRSKAALALLRKQRSDEG